MDVAAAIGLSPGTNHQPINLPLTTSGPHSCTYYLDPKGVQKNSFMGKAKTGPKEGLVGPVCDFPNDLPKMRGICLGPTYAVARRSRPDQQPPKKRHFLQGIASTVMALQSSWIFFFFFFFFRLLLSFSALFVAPVAWTDACIEIPTPKKSLT